MADFDLEKGAPSSSAPTPSSSASIKESPKSGTSQDVEDIHAWSTGKKIFITGILCVGVFSLTFSSSAYSSSIPQIREEFGISQEVALLGIALFVLGFSFSPLLFAPLSLIIGHRWTYIISFTMFTAFSFGASEANSGATLIVMRFLAGTTGGSMFNNSPATIQDFITLAQVNRFTIFFAIAAFGGPGVGPVIAAFVTNRASWRWNMRVQAILVAVVLIFVILFVPETNRSVLEARANKVKRKKGALFLERLYGPWKYLIDPVSFSVCLYLSILYGILYGFFGIIPYVFEGIRGFSPESTGLVFISLVIGFMTAGLIIFFPQQWYYEKLAREGGPSNIKPEDRFHQALWAAWLIPIGLFIFAWTAPFKHVHWIFPCIGMTLFSIGTGCVFTSFIPYIALYGGPEAPLVLAAATFSRSAVGASFPLFITQMNKRMTVQGSNSFLAGLALLLAPLPWLFRWKGAVVRERAEAKRNAKTAS